MSGSSITINSNAAALMTQRYVNQASSSLNSSYQRLSSGLRINRASDDAAGLAVSSLLSADAKVYEKAAANADDAISMLSISDGALSELSNITIRIKELAEQAANSTLSVSQRQPLHDEANALVAEYNRIVSSTQFNNIDLLSGATGSVQAQLGYGQASQVSFSTSGKITTNVSTGVYGAGVNYTGGVSASGVATGDLNGDGYDDIVTSDYGSTGVIFRIGNGDGTFKAATSVVATDVSLDVLLVDLNQDSVLDIAIASGNGLDVAFGNGNGTFKSVTNVTTASAGTPNQLKAGDFNNDGITDVVVGTTFGGGTQNLNVILNNGNGTFKSGFGVGGLSSRPWVADVGDINNDGKLDILVGKESTVGLSVVLGNGDGSFQLASSISTGATSDDVVLSDINRDGKLDFVVSVSGTTLYYAMGNGNGTFGAQVSLSSSGQLEMLDYNGDGYVDIAATGSGSMRLFTGNGNGTFQAALSVAISSTDLASGDFNNDGALDFAFTDDAGRVIVSMPTTRVTSQIPYVNLLSRGDAADTLTGIDSVITRVNAEKGANGAYSSRLNYGRSVISSTKESYISAASQITDADVAEETAKLVRNKIIQQAGTAVLAQANNSPAIALKLLSDLNTG